MTINRLPLYQQAYLALRHAIADGELTPGDRVDVQTMADRLDISRTPVREAIRQLIQEGLLEASRDGRVHVYSPSVEDLAEIYLVRASLEAMAAEVVATKEPPADLSGLEEAHDRGLRAAEADDWREVSAANTAFHEGIIALSENATCLRILDTIRLQVHRYRNLSMQFPQRRDTAVSEHGQLLAMLQARDAAAVRHRLYQHVLEAGRFAVSTLKPDTVDDTPAVRFVRRVDEHHEEPG